MSQRLKPLIVLLAALVMALIWTMPATAGDDASETSSPPSSDGLGEVIDDGGDIIGSLVPTPTTSEATETGADSDEAEDSNDTDDTGSVVPSVPSTTSVTPKPSPTANSPQARVGTVPDPRAAAVAAPVSPLAVLPPGFGLEELEELLGPDGLDLGLSPAQLAELLETLEGLGQEEDPLEDFCGAFNVPVLCGEIDPENPPAFSCEQFAVLFGFEDCESIPLCIPLPSPPAALPLPPAPSPPFCAAPPSGTPTPTTPNNPGTNKPPTYQPGQTHAGYQYKNCDEARAAGAAPVYAGAYGYGTHLDADYDGIGCEEDRTAHYTGTHPVAYETSGGKLAYTGVTVQPLIAWGTALAVAGSWLMLSGRRRV